MGMSFPVASQSSLISWPTITAPSVTHLVILVILVIRPQASSPSRKFLCQSWVLRTCSYATWAITNDGLDLRLFIEYPSGASDALDVESELGQSDASCIRGIAVVPNKRIRSLDAKTSNNLDAVNAISARWMVSMPLSWSLSPPVSR
ncbi:hypothetical protein EsH8_V_000714 [Colletotrichum jinshuiense]